MIYIEYTDEFLEGEPGPNFYWRGRPRDFIKIIADLHPLGSNNETEIKLNNLALIQVNSDHIITARSCEGGSTLCSIKGNNILIELDKKLWRGVISLFLSVSFERSHNYVEFDNYDLKEDANFIINSEI
ncbi:MAG TPA: hypothetical protein EYH19_07870 [Desulfocapsa sulfexigens]|nr:hypothetical protein [Desulfocapsa sulfexigens]